MSKIRATIILVVLCGIAGGCASTIAAKANCWTQIDHAISDQGNSE